MSFCHRAIAFSWLLTAQAGAVPIVFPSATSTWVNSPGNNPASFFFNDTHSVSETFTLAGLAAVNTASFDFQMISNANNGFAVNFDVLINSVVVGNSSASSTGRLKISA